MSLTLRLSEGIRRKILRKDISINFDIVERFFEIFDSSFHQTY